jgi:hypothetical protein
MAPAFSGPGGLGWSSVWLYRSVTSAYPAQTAFEAELCVRSAKEFQAQSLVQDGPQARWLSMWWSARPGQIRWAASSAGCAMIAERGILCFRQSGDLIWRTELKRKMTLSNLITSRLCDRALLASETWRLSISLSFPFNCSQDGQ